jgi:hypothetical protein
VPLIPVVLKELGSVTFVVTCFVQDILLIMIMVALKEEELEFND